MKTMNEKKQKQTNENIHRIQNVDLIKDSSSPEADAIIRLQTNIDFASIDKKISCYAITSAQEAEGKTTMSGNLAKMYAEKGIKVALVDLDLRRPSIHKLFHIKNEVGVVEYVKGEVDSLDEITHNVDGVDLITAGTHTPFPGKILVSEKMKQLLAELKEKYDYVLLDTPPVLVVSDAFLIGHDIDGFLLVCAQHVSRKKSIVDAVNALTEKQINIIGIAMDMVTSNEDQGKGGYGGYGYGYGYKYGYKSEYYHKKPKKNKQQGEDK